MRKSINTVEIEIDGHAFTLVQYGAELVKYATEEKLQPAFWTWKDERGYGPSLGWESNKHVTAADAEKALRDHLTITNARDEATAAAETIVDRATYEAACARLGISAHSDAEIEAAAYGLKYMEIDSPYNAPAPAEEIAAKYRRAIPDRARLDLVESERAARRTPAPVQAQTWSGTRYDETCARCGREGEVENETGLCERCFA